MDYIIAIDGPSGVGKSTIAKKLSKILKINYIDTGAMYRAIAYKVISNNISLDDHDKIKKILEDTDFTYKSNYLYVDGVKLGKEIRTDEISKGASLVSSYDYVRNHLVSLQRKIGMEGSCVLDGRDVGTVIFPNADFKFYLTASSKERAKRRFLQSERKKGLNLEQVRESIEKRDFDDMNRSASPLKKAKDAIEIDSTNKTLKENQPFIISANHIHIFDPVILATLTKRQIFFLSKKELFEKKLFAKFFGKLGVIPIDRDNTDIKAIKSCFRVIRAGNILGIFPEGTRVKTVDINNMKKGVALIALKNKVNILPIHIEGTYRIFSKITVDIYPMIEINNFENMEDSEAIDKLTEELFNQIYQVKYGNTNS